MQFSPCMDSTIQYIISTTPLPVYPPVTPSILPCEMNSAFISLYVCSYFAGHDHNLQHIKENSSDVYYFISGAGLNTDPSTAHVVNIPLFNLNNLKFALPEHKTLLYPSLA